MNPILVSIDSLMEAFESLPQLTEDEITASMLAKKLHHTHNWAMKVLKAAVDGGEYESHLAWANGHKVLAFRKKEQK